MTELLVAVGLGKSFVVSSCLLRTIIPSTGSPRGVALIDYIKCDFDVNVYWRTLNENGITKERLLSYDRAIHSEPSFRREQKDGLLRDLGSYMRTLKAVHLGVDLESAISNCMGYKSEGQGFMVGVEINPVSGLPSGFPDLLRFILAHVEDKNIEALLEGLLEVREELMPLLSTLNDRLKDLLFLDIALDSTVRTAIERGYEELNSAKPEVHSIVSCNIYRSPEPWNLG